MKVFLTSIVDDSNKNNIELVCDFFKYNNIEIINSLYKDDSSNNEISDSSSTLAMLSSADIFVGEMSNPSQTLGFLLSYSLHLKKPCLYLHPKKKKRSKPHPPILNNASRLLSIKEYTDDNLLTILESFVKAAYNKMASVRTTFLSTKKINDFLGEETRRTGLSKGEILRSIIEKEIDLGLNDY